jgi:CheY-like chemotaxis protein
VFPEPQGIRVLLAEDDADLRTLVAQGLRKDGFEVVEVANGLQLLDYLASLLAGDKSGAPAQLIVSDVRMPGVTGLSVLAGLHASGLDVPVILLTAFADEETRAEAKQLGAFALVDKPFDMDALRRLVRRSAARLLGRDGEGPWDVPRGV